jgi:hypothetical protein
MLPTGHVEFTWAGLHLLQSRLNLFREADMRWVSLAALAPDLLDKPLALTLYRDTEAALFWGHNLWLHLAVWGVAVAVNLLGVRTTRQRTRLQGFLAGATRPLPYLLAFSGHLIADRMWGFQESLFYPFGAGYWHPWVHVGEPQAMLSAYIEIIRTTPILVAFEVIGLALLVWVAHERGWASRLRNLLGSLPFCRLHPRGTLPTDDEA